MENTPRIRYVGYPRKKSPTHDSKEGSSSCQCTPTLYGENKETQKNVRKISYSYELCSQMSALLVLGFRSENKWYETCSGKPDGEWDTTVE